MTTQQQRVQKYLQSHKIGALFEELMGKVIIDLPDEPMRYLVGILQLKLDKNSKKQGDLSRSSTSPIRHRNGSPEQLRRTAPVMDWATTDKDRLYEKPWKTNSKTIKMKSPDEDPRMYNDKGQRAKPDWDSKMKVQATSFEDLWAEPGAVKKSQTVSSSVLRASTSTPGVNWSTGKDENPAFASRGYSGPSRPSANDDDSLTREIPRSHKKEKYSKKESSSYRVSGGRIPTRKADTLKRQKELQVLLAKKDKHPTTHDDRGNSPLEDGAVELHEDIDALRMEGVANSKHSGGVKISRTHRHAAEAEIKVAICARCARFIGSGALSSDPATGFGYSDLPDSASDIENISHPPSARYLSSPAPLKSDYDDEDDDEFESVSQVSGPRRPVWHDREKNPTPRRGKHVLSSSLQPSKGQPMYSNGSARASQSKKMTPGRAKSDIADLCRNGAQRRDVNRFSSDDDDASAGGGRWILPDFDADDSSVYVTGVGNSRNYQSQAY